MPAPKSRELSQPFHTDARSTLFRRIRFERVSRASAVSQDERNLSHLWTDIPSAALSQCLLHRMEPDCCAGETKPRCWCRVQRCSFSHTSNAGTAQMGIPQSSTLNHLRERAILG